MKLAPVTAVAARRLPTMTPEHAEELLRALAVENRELRELLEAVAQELERLACRLEADSAAFLAQAARIRARLHAA
jgi:hypothetical protein